MERAALVRYLAAVPSLTVSRDVAAPADVVFNVATDLDAAAETIAGIESIDILERGAGGRSFDVGTKWRETRVIMGKRATETMWISEFEPGRRYVAEAESCGTHYRTSVQVEPAGQGRSRVSYAFDGRPVTLFARLMTPLGFLFKGVMRKCAEADLADIAKAAESRVAA